MTARQLCLDDLTFDLPKVVYDDGQTQLSESHGFLLTRTLDPTRKHGQRIASPESAAAHAAVTPTKEATRLRLLDLAIRRGDLGITADEVAALWRCSHNTVAPRMTELLRDGRLVRTDRRRPTRSGCSARVLVARAQE